jgi:hypothetical protein
VLQFARPAREASALAPRLALPQAVCSGASATVTFGWTPVPGAIDLWLDISLVDDGFQPGTASRRALLLPARNALSWEGLTPGAVHYWRVNARMDGGWRHPRPARSSLAAARRSSGAGPMDAATDRYFRDGLRTGVPYFFRVTALGSDGVWRSTAVAGFTVNCAGQPASGDGLYGLRASSFELRASSFELRASSFELRASSFELRASSFEQ